ncbi:alpha-glucan family phosphorylase, partial [bacterium]|nr:alpha-glucan family phosphorylase [bacterium]
MFTGKKKKTGIEKELDNLIELANNLRFSWNDEIRRLFRDIDSYLWNEVEGNPVDFLKELDIYTFEERLGNKKFYKNYLRIINESKEYLEKTSELHKQLLKVHSGESIAYFCLEFGLHSSLPIYSGGLGILAGDHLKTASDLGIPIIGVGLLYRQAYFTQQITNDGMQQSFYQNNKFSGMPIKRIVDKNNRQVRIKLNINGGIYIRAWKAEIGRTYLLLLDTDFEMNNQINREITQRLYVSDREMRLMQEIVLG